MLVLFPGGGVGGGSGFIRQHSCKSYAQELNRASCLIESCRKWLPVFSNKREISKYLMLQSYCFQVIYYFQKFKNMKTGGSSKYFVRTAGQSRLWSVPIRRSCRVGCCDPGALGPPTLDLARGQSQGRSAASYTLTVSLARNSRALQGVDGNKAAAFCSVPGATGHPAVCVGVGPGQGTPDPHHLAGTRVRPK